MIVVLDESIHRSVVERLHDRKRDESNTIRSRHLCANRHIIRFLLQQFRQLTIGYRHFFPTRQQSTSNRPVRELFLRIVFSTIPSPRTTYLSAQKENKLCKKMCLRKRSERRTAVQGFRQGCQRSFVNGYGLRLPRYRQAHYCRLQR